MDTSDTNIKFNDQGVCDHCQNYKKNLRKIIDESNKENFKIKKIIKKIKSKKNKNGFDCIIGLSGGVDSSYLAHYIVKELHKADITFIAIATWLVAGSANSENILPNN